jgi:hypothetical protein
MSFCLGTPKWESRNSQNRDSHDFGGPWLWRPITLCVNLQLRWGLKQSCSTCQAFFNGKSHATWTQGNQGDFGLLMVGNQIANLTSDPYFGHNLCFNYTNGPCEPSLNMYNPRTFHWYKEILNPMGFYPSNCSLKIQESIGNPTPKVGVHLGVWMFIPSHSPTFPRTWDVTSKLHSWPAPSQTFALVANLRLGLRHESTKAN